MGNGILTSWRRLVISRPKVLVLPVALLSWGHRAAAQGTVTAGARNSPAERRDRPAGPGPRRGTPGRRKCGRRPEAASRCCGRALRRSFGIALPEVLPPSFTIEFDLVPKACGCGDHDLEFDGTAGTWAAPRPGCNGVQGPGVSGGGPSPFTMTTPT